MEIDKEKFKKLITFVINNFKAIETELVAFQLTLHALKQVRPSEAEFFETSLKAARISKPLQDQMRQKYDVALDRFLQQGEQSEPAEWALKFLQEWQPPKGPVN